MSLFGFLLKKNASRNLAMSKYRHLFDGVDDYISIDGSSAAGSAFDFSRTDSFTLACKFNLSNFNAGLVPMLFSKGISGARYILYWEATANVQSLTLTFVTSTGEVSRISRAVANNVNYSIAATYDGTSSNSGIVLHFYQDDVLIVRCSIANGNALTNSSPNPTFTGSINNTSPLYIGGIPGYASTLCKGTIEQPSVWKVKLSNTQVDELVLLMKAKNVQDHSLYTSDCVGYWKQYAGKLISMKNINNNGTYSGFTKPTG